GFSINNGGVPLERIGLLNRKLTSLYQEKQQFQETKISDITLSEPDMWVPYFTKYKLFGKINDVMIKQMSITNTIELFNNFSLDEWMVYLKIRYLYEYQDVLRLQIDEYSNSRIAIEQVKKSFGDDLNRLCLGEALEQNQKQVVDILRNVVSAYMDSVKQVGWMSNYTKEHIIEVLSTLRVEFGYKYMVERMGYSELPITLDNPLSNAMRLKEFDYLYKIDQVGVRGGEIEYNYSDSPRYFPETNKIIIPIKFLITPYFISNDNAFNYGAIGFSIAHEIAHAVSVDNNGKLIVWKTKEKDKTDPVVNKLIQKDVAEFNERVNKLKKQYGIYNPYPDLTVVEDIADNIGFPVARKAYQMSLKEKGLENKEEMPGDIKFYYSFAQQFRGQSSDDSHSAPEVRVNVILRNQDEFYTLFNIKPEDKKMYLAPTDRVKFW